MFCILSCDELIKQTCSKIKQIKNKIVQSLYALKRSLIYNLFILGRYGNKQKEQRLCNAFENDTLSTKQGRFTGKYANSEKMHLKSVMIVAKIRNDVKFGSKQSQS